jgi:hypothetical protein
MRTATVNSLAACFMCINLWEREDCSYFVANKTQHAHRGCRECGIRTWVLMHALNISVKTGHCTYAVHIYGILIVRRCLETEDRDQNHQNQESEVCSCRYSRATNDRVLDVVHDFKVRIACQWGHANQHSLMKVACAVKVISGIRMWLYALWGWAPLLWPF